MNVEQVVIDDAQEIVLVDGVFASTVLLLLVGRGVVSGIVLVEVIVVTPLLHELQGTVTVVR